MLSILEIFKRHKFTADQKRNLRLDVFLLLFGLSFALEKLLLGLGIVFNDWFWFTIYGFFAFFTIALFFHDFYHDIKEEKARKKS